MAAKHSWRANSMVTLAAQYDIVTVYLTCTKSSRKASGSAYCGSLPNLATASQLRSTAQDSMWTKLCSIACRDARLPPLPSAGILPGATTLTYSCAETSLNTLWYTVTMLGSAASRTKQHTGYVIGLILCCHLFLVSLAVLQQQSCQQQAGAAPTA